MKALRVASLTLAVMIPAPVGSAQPAAESFRCALVPEPVNTLTVKFETDKKTYRLGALMKVKVTVTRPGPKDPVTGEIDLPSAMAMPVEGAVVAVTLRSGGDTVIQTQGGITNQDGISNVPLKIKKHHETGVADISVFATKVQYDDGVCIHLWEQGYIYKERAVTLLP